MKANTNPQKEDKTPIPWLWFMLGFGLAAALLVGVWFGLQSFLLQSPAGAAANPIIIQLTAPPSPIHHYLSLQIAVILPCIITTNTGI